MSSLLGGGDTVIGDTILFLPLARDTGKKADDTVGWDLCISLSEHLLAVPSQSALGAPLGGP